jgi:ATP-dependent helicase/nuclease subunit B
LTVAGEIGRSGRGQPRLFSIPPGAPFLKTLVAGLCEGTLVPGFAFERHDPLCLSRATIFVPTRRAARELRSEFVDYIATGSAILPVIKPLGEIDDDGGLFEESDPASLDLLPAIDGHEALLEVASLVQAWKTTLPEAVSGFHAGSPLIAPASPADAVWLARGLLDLFEAMETEGCPWSRLDRLAAADHAEWWQLTLEFLKIAAEFWPARLQELSRMSAAGHRNALLATQAQRFALSVPRGPVIVAGSTGSIPATAALMKAIVGLDQGALVFPGLDLGLSDEVWSLIRATDPALADAAAVSHPQYGLALLLDKLGFSRDDVRELGTRDPALAKRATIVSQALLPARATSLWAEAAVQETDESAMRGLSLVEAAGEREEAVAIALAMRAAAEDPSARVALVTPDRNIARRVTVELHRFGIEANDSAGRPLETAPQATLLRLLLDAVMQPGDPVALCGLIAHPLARFGLGQEEKARAAHALELLALRGTVGEIDIAGLGPLLKEALQRREANARHQPQWRRRLGERDVELARKLATRIEHCIEPLTGRFVRFAREAPDHRRLGTRTALADWARETIEVLEAVAADEAGDAQSLWTDEAGERLAALFTAAIASKTVLQADGAEWADIVGALLAGETVKPKSVAHPRIFIWGALEARLQDVDTVVLAGLNEGTWPSQTANDAFLSRAMKHEIGLDPPERRTGLAAHDIQMAIGTRNVVLTRSLRADGAPTIASRWLQRLLVVSGKEGARLMRDGGGRYLQAAAALDRRDPVELARRPAPRPPRDRQPKRYSFSEVKTLRRDPYAIYARRVLKVDPLEPLVRDPGVAERGTLYHAILERFVRAGIDPAGDEALERLMAIAEDCFAGERLPPHIEVLWRPRFERLAHLFIDWDGQRSGEIIRRLPEERAEMPIFESGVTLSGMADRIDIRHDGTAEIIDYKSGTRPSRKEARALLDPQLPLEAAALRHGGFAGLGAVEPASLLYVRLKDDDVLPVDRLEGSDKKNKSDETHRSAADLGDLALERLAGLIATLAEGRQGFASRIIPVSARDFGGDYDHLARVAEWSNSDDGDGDDNGDAGS